MCNLINFYIVSPVVISCLISSQKSSNFCHFYHFFVIFDDFLLKSCKIKISSIPLFMGFFKEVSINRNQTVNVCFIFIIHSFHFFFQFLLLIFFASLFSNFFFSFSSTFRLFSGVGMSFGIIPPISAIDFLPFH